ncbi:uncharacterized protein [Manis javanica]|uniref:uncharacterized protein isoform X1 n=1 Tax=Manis javanica TaxID=9974 RepID=UPI003C6CE793
MIPLLTLLPLRHPRPRHPRPWHRQPRHPQHRQPRHPWHPQSLMLRQWDRLRDLPRELGATEGPPWTHQPAWDDCQQLLQVLFTTEERERILLQARKNVPGTDGRPSQLPHDIERGFPLTRPNWDFNSPEGRERLTIYRQALVAGLRGATRRPTNLAKVREVSQGATEAPAVYLERLMEAFRRYTPFDPTSEEHSASVALAFIGQSAPDIRKKLQRLEGLQDLSLRDLVKEAEKVYHKRETEEEKELKKEKKRESKEEKRDRKHERNLTKILAAVVESKGRPPSSSRTSKAGHLGNWPPLDKDQCAYCKEKRH